MKHNHKSAGRIGGRATVEKHGREHMRAIGKRGAAVTWARYYLAPLNESQYAMVDRKTQIIKAIR